jgi:CubicO group peptidase (beta-lactamase class C family)
MFLLNRFLAVLFFTATVAHPLCDMESTAPTAPDVTPLVEKIDEYINACVVQKKFNGSVLIAQRGTVLVNKGYGMADFEHHIPCTPTTKFRLGSITKQFTAMAIMILQEQGRLNVSDPIFKYIPLAEFPLGDKVTIYHCLTNTPGLQDYLNCPTSNFSKTKEALKFHTASEIIASFKDAPLEFEPGSQYKYCNSGWVLLTTIIERVSGTSYEAFLQRNIFAPLGMNNSCIDSQQKEIDGRAHGYTRKASDKEDGIVPADFVDMSCAQGAGILLSTVEDMYVWDRALYADRLVQKVAIETLFTPNKDKYACGWVIQKLFDKKLVWHNGGIDGCASCFYRFIDDDVCIIVLSNLDTVDQDHICKDLAAIVFEQPSSLPHLRTAIVVDPVIFDSYVGNYKLTEDFILTITKEEDKFYAQLTGKEVDDDKVQLLPESETDFFVKTTQQLISFAKDEHGIVTKLILHQNGCDDVAEKI